MTDEEVIINESRADISKDELKEKSSCLVKNQDENSLPYLGDEKSCSEAPEGVNDNCLPTESCSSWLPTKTKNPKASSQMSSCVTALGSSHILPLFTSHPEEKYFHLKKEIQESKLPSLSNEIILSTLERFQKTNRWLQCSSSLLTHFSHQAATRALHRSSLRSQLQNSSTQIKRIKLDVDIPPVFYKDSQTSVKTCAQKLSREAQFELLYSSVEAFREKTIITFKKYCFRILRHLNIVIPSWGSFNDSFQWHSHSILNASSIQQISNYVIIFEDIIENIFLRLAEAKKKFYEQANACTSSNDMGEKEKSSSASLHISDSTDQSKHDINLKSCDAPIGADESEHSLKNITNPFKESPQSAYALMKQNTTTMLLKIPLLTALIYQVDADIIARSILYLDLIRKKADHHFVCSPNLDETMKSFITQQNFHSITQSPLHFLLDKSLVFRSLANFNLHSTKRNRRRTSAIQYPLYSGSSLQGEGTSDVPQVSQSKYARQDKK